MYGRWRSRIIEAVSAAELTHRCSSLVKTQKGSGVPVARSEIAPVDVVSSSAMRRFDVGRNPVGRQVVGDQLGLSVCCFARTRSRARSRSAACRTASIGYVCRIGRLRPCRGARVSGRLVRGWLLVVKAGDFSTYGRTCHRGRPCVGTGTPFLQAESSTHPAHVPRMLAVRHAPDLLRARLWYVRTTDRKAELIATTWRQLGSAHSRRPHGRLAREQRRLGDLPIALLGHAASFWVLTSAKSSDVSAQLPKSASMNAGRPPPAYIDKVLSRAQMRRRDARIRRCWIRV